VIAEQRLRARCSAAKSYIWEFRAYWNANLVSFDQF